jgi:mono/diheme cytochrome c family protein
MNKKIVGFGLAAALIGGGAFYLSSGTQSSALSPGGLFPYKDQSTVQKGAEIYAQTCAACHGENLEGEPNWQQPKDTGRMPAPPHDETGHTWHHKDQLLFAITKFGIAKLTNNPDYQTDMPVYEDVLSDDEIIAVLAYIKSKWPEEIQERHDMFNAQK